MRRIVKHNISSALILEDDVDWDVRIRHQLRDLALSTRALTQPLVNSPGKFADPTYANPADASTERGKDILFESLPRTVAPSTSPYGDNWDLLWLGHCAMEFPTPEDKVLPRGRVAQANDDTVAEKRYLWSFSDPYQWKDEYPEHTRVVHHAKAGVCALGYAVTQRGARGLLKEIALKDVSDAYDVLLRFFCEGMQGRRSYRCLTTQPGLIHHHRPAGSMSAQSDIGNHGDGYREEALSDAIRWSTRRNTDALLDGATVFYDSLPNGEDSLKKAG